MKSEFTTSLFVAAALFCVPLLYVGSYCWLVQRGLEAPSWHLKSAPRYGAIDCAAVRAAYQPVHAVDRLVRREYWDQEAFIY
jgi:hypothetical protein